MKKLGYSLMVLLLSANIYGQINLGSFSSIETTPTGNNTIEDGIRRTNFANGNYSWIPDVHFLKGKFLYMLAYEPNFPRGYYNDTERNVYLYCKDTTGIKNNWIRVSDAVLTNYYLDKDNYQDIDFFEFDPEQHNTSSSKVVLDGNNLIFTVDIHKMTNGSLTITSQTIILKLIRRTLDGDFYATVCAK